MKRFRPIHFKKIVILLAVFFLLSCGSSNYKKVESESTSPESLVQKSAEISNGKKVYDQYCLTCHQSDGNGTPGMHPPLVNSDWVNGDKVRLIKLIMNGMSGPLEIKGDLYNNLMPPHSHLSDQEIADVLTYVRSNFENQSSEVTLEEVKRQRN